MARVEGRRASRDERRVTRGRFPMTDDVNVRRLYALRVLKLTLAIIVSALTILRLLGLL